jgi:hypothetical protein
VFVTRPRPEKAHATQGGGTRAYDQGATSPKSTGEDLRRHDDRTHESADSGFKPPGLKGEVTVYFQGLKAEVTV